MSNVSLVNGHIDRTEMMDSEISKRRIKAIYPHITVGGTIDNPCYSIDWYDVDENTMHSGFSSYNLEFVRKWLEEEFEVVEANSDGILEQGFKSGFKAGVKAFAEKVKEKLTSSGKNTTYGNFCYGTIKSYEIDNLLKEMVGDK